MIRIHVALVMILAVCFALPVQASNVSGRVVAVDQPAQILANGRSRVLRAGDDLPTGSVIQTGRTGRVQAQFPDGTKIVVGPNSTMTIDDTLFAPSGLATNFNVSAIGGAFRFITGASPKSVYKVSTPLATMGVRGTAFDFAVDGGSATHLLVYEGRVKFCSAPGRCADVPGGCHAVSVDRRQNYSQPRTQADKRRLLASAFPLEMDQGRLSLPFRTAVAGCNRAVQIVLPSPMNQGLGQNDHSTRGNDRGGHSGNPAQ